LQKKERKPRLVHIDDPRFDGGKKSINPKLLQRR